MPWNLEPPTTWFCFILLFLLTNNNNSRFEDPEADTSRFENWEGYAKPFAFPFKGLPHQIGGVLFGEALENGGCPPNGGLRKSQGHW